MLKRKAEVFAPTDGMLSVGADTSARLARGADFCDATLLDELYPLAYRRMRVSSRDVELADSTGSEITAKVEVRTSPSMNADCDVVVDGRVFEVTRVENRGRTSWLWLSEMATDGTCELLPNRVERDANGIPLVESTKGSSVLCRKAKNLLSKSTRVPGTVAADPSKAVVTLRVRSIDYLGERFLMRGGDKYTVISSEGAGKWVDLTCMRKVADL